ncbi:MAG: hypothetical protein ACJ76Y_13050 [Thermoanaerobaculia bacterium]
MPLDDLQEFVKKLNADADAGHQATLAAAQNYRAAREAFLQEFRDLADREIRPVFEAVLLKSDSVTIKLDNRSDLIGLDVYMKKGEAESVSGHLRYRADIDRRQIFREERIDRLPNRDRNLLVHPPSELIEERIGQIVESLLRDVKYALYNKRAY